MPTSSTGGVENVNDSPNDPPKRWNDSVNAAGPEQFGSLGRKTRSCIVPVIRNPFAYAVP